MEQTIEAFIKSLPAKHNRLFNQNQKQRFSIMPYQYKRGSLNNDGIDKLINSCDTPREKFVIWLLLDTALTPS